MSNMSNIEITIDFSKNTYVKTNNNTFKSNIITKLRSAREILNNDDKFIELKSKLVDLLRQTQNVELTVRDNYYRIKCDLYNNITGEYDNTEESNTSQEGGLFGFFKKPQPVVSTKPLSKEDIAAKKEVLKEVLKEAEKLENLKLEKVYKLKNIFLTKYDKTEKNKLNRLCINIEIAETILSINERKKMYSGSNNFNLEIKKINEYIDNSIKKYVSDKEILQLTEIFKKKHGKTYTGDGLLEQVDLELKKHLQQIHQKTWTKVKSPYLNLSMQLNETEHELYTAYAEGTKALDTYKSVLQSEKELENANILKEGSGNLEIHQENIDKLSTELNKESVSLQEGGAGSFFSKGLQSTRSALFGKPLTEIEKVQESIAKKEKELENIQISYVKKELFEKEKIKIAKAYKKLENEKVDDVTTAQKSLYYKVITFFPKDVNLEYVKDVLLKETNLQNAIRELQVAENEVTKTEAKTKISNARISLENEKIKVQKILDEKKLNYEYLLKKFNEIINKIDGDRPYLYTRAIYTRNNVRKKRDAADEEAQKATNESIKEYEKGERIIDELTELEKKLEKLKTIPESSAVSDPLHEGAGWFDEEATSTETSTESEDVAETTTKTEETVTEPATKEEAETEETEKTTEDTSETETKAETATEISGGFNDDFETQTYLIDSYDSDEESLILNAKNLSDKKFLSNLNVNELRDIMRTNNMKLSKNGNYLKKIEMIKNIKNIYK